MKLNWGTTLPFPEKFLHNKRDTMCWSAPLELLKGNPYFKYLEKFLNPWQGSPSRVSMHGTFVHAKGNSESKNILNF